MPPLPTGVNDLTVFDTYGHILADRLFFVNNHDYDGFEAEVDSGMKNTFEPYEKIDLGVKCHHVSEPTWVSVAVRDQQTDEPTYNDGDIMTDLLLSSELKGFVAHPAYYFESDDTRHRQALDLLMMVQGWRKYKWEELSDSSMLPKRYAPEKTMTIEGCVHQLSPDQNTDYTTDDINGRNNNAQPSGITQNQSRSVKQQTGNLKKEVIVEAELIVGHDVAGQVQKTHDGGRFLFQVPPFYGLGTLNMKAYQEKDSVKKNMVSGQVKGYDDEEAYPDYYVKRDLFYPRFAAPYSFYQNHIPDIITPVDTLSEWSMENGNTLLRNVNVKGKRHGRRAVDYSKPAYVNDTYELYNEATDYGLSYGVFDMSRFPEQVCELLFGNMGRDKHFNVAARLDDERVKGYNFFTNYSASAVTGASSSAVSRNPKLLERLLKLKHFSDLRVFTDFELRNIGQPVEEISGAPDVTLVFVPLPDESEQPTFRDRHITLQGFDYPFDFYSPDYSARHPQAPTDYRRTLYWNPNVQTDSNGHFNISLYNNSRETRIKVSVCGITPDGHFIRTHETK